jgi:hypothetical protein
MKECPECKRTYAGDMITFCLADGSLLSPPYDPPKVTITSSRDELPTEVIPPHRIPRLLEARRSSGSKYIAAGLLCLLIGVVGAMFLKTGGGLAQANYAAFERIRERATKIAA